MKAELLEAPGKLAPASRPATSKLRKVYHEHDAPAWSVLAGRIGMQNMRGMMPALQKATQVTLAANGLRYASVS